MKAHTTAGTIPDPYQSPTAALEALRPRAEIFQNTDRFLHLTAEKNAKAIFTTGANVQALLQLLPRRVRDMENLNATETDDEQRNLQYDTVKKWVNKSNENLLL